MIDLLPVPLTPQRSFGVVSENRELSSADREVDRPGGSMAEFQDLLIAAMAKGGVLHGMALSLPVVDLKTPPAQPLLPPETGSAPSSPDRLIPITPENPSTGHPPDRRASSLRPQQEVVSSPSDNRPVTSDTSPAGSSKPDADTPLSRSNMLRVMTDGSSARDGVEIIRHRSAVVQGSPNPSMTVGVFLKSDQGISSFLIVPVNPPRGGAEGRLLSVSPAVQPSFASPSTGTLRSLERSHFPPPSVEPKWILEKIASQIRISTREGRTEIRIQLRPEHLGKMVIRVVAAEDGTLTGKIYVANQDVKNLLLSNISSLHETLREQGLAFSQLDVFTGDESSHNAFNGQGSKPSSHVSGEIKVETTYRQIAEEFLRDAYGYSAVNISA